MGIKEIQAALNSLLLLVLLFISASRNMRSQCLFNPVDLISDVVGSPVFNFVNHRRLLVDCFGQLFLSEFLGNSSSLDGLCALVTHNLVLNLFIFILDGVKVSNCTRLVVNGVNVVLSALDGTSCEVAVRLASILFELVLIVLLLCFPLLLRLHCLPLH